MIRLWNLKPLCISLNAAVYPGQNTEFPFLKTIKRDILMRFDNFLRKNMACTPAKSILRIPNAGLVANFIQQSHKI